MSDSPSKSNIDDAPKIYYLRLNGKPADSAIEFETTSSCTLQKLLLNSRKLFSKDVSTPITCAYTDNGKLIKHLEDVPDGSIIVLSCGEQFYGKKFYLIENGNPKTARGPKNKPSYRSNGNLERLFTDATSILKLNQPAKVAYTQEGKRILSLSDAPKEKQEKLIKDAKNEKIALFENLPEESVIVISTGSNFIPVMTQKERQQKLKDTIAQSDKKNQEREITFDKDYMSQQMENYNNIDSRSTKSSMTAITISHQKRSRYARYHQLLAVLPGSVEDHIRDSMIATYVSLPEDIKSNLENKDMYEKMLRQTQVHLFTEELVHQMICQQRSTSPIDDEIINWALDKLDEVPITEIRFEVMGPRYSGKTMLLSALSSVLYQKLLVSDLRDNYMMFPINIALHALNLDSPIQLYPSIINISFNSVRYCRFDLLPFLLNLRQWFLLAPTVGSMTKLPPELSTLPNVDYAAITNLGKQFHNAFHSNSTDISEFMNMIFSFPNNIAKAIGMKSAIYVIDHLDCATPEAIKAILSVISPQASSPSSLKTTTSSPNKKSKNSNFVPFIFASQNDKVYSKNFKLKSATQLDTRNSIDLTDSPLLDTDIFVQDLQLRFGANNLLGCPGFITSFANLCNIVSKDFQMSEKASLKGARYSQITPKISVFRRGESDQEFRKLALALAMANCDVIEFDTLNRIDEDESLVLKVISNKSKK